jgi:hypothetical protein
MHFGNPMAEFSVFFSFIIELIASIWFSSSNVVAIVVGVDDDYFSRLLLL